MRTKNKPLLIRRVNSNIREDRLTNSTYADVARRSKKKKPPAQVCGIGCIGLPHTIRERKAFVLQTGTGSGMRLLWDELENQFGIGKPLGRLLESAFMANREYGLAAAEEFMRTFARRLPEDTVIDGRHVKAFCRLVGLEYDEYAHNPSTTDVMIRGIVRRERVSITDTLYAWLDNGARVKGLKVPA